METQTDSTDEAHRLETSPTLSRSADFLSHDLPSHHPYNYKTSRHDTLLKTTKAWRSEESMRLPSRQLTNQPQRRSIRVILKGKPSLSLSDRALEPPPLPARGDGAVPPLPPKPQRMSGGYVEAPLSAPVHFDPSTGDYQNFQPLGRPVTHETEPAEDRLPRRGSLDSMLEKYEPPKYSDSESEAGSADLLTSIVATWDEKLRDLGPRPKPGRTDSSSTESRTPTSQPGASMDRSRESLLSILSNKAVITNCESESSHDMESSDRGFDGSSSSISSNPKPETKVGIASRIERKDMKPSGYGPHSVRSGADRVPAQHTRHSSAENSSDGETDFHNNNVTEEPRLVHRRMSDEKKRIRRRHTVGGARDFDVLRDLMSDYNSKKTAKLNEANNLLFEADPGHQLPGWKDITETLSIHWPERGRYRASSTDIDIGTTPNIMHLQKVGRRLASSVLGTNT